MRSGRTGIFTRSRGCLTISCKLTCSPFVGRSTKTGAISPAWNPFFCLCFALNTFRICGRKRAPVREISSDAADMFDRASPKVSALAAKQNESLFALKVTRTQSFHLYKRNMIFIGQFVPGDLLEPGLLF